MTRGGALRGALILLLSLSVAACSSVDEERDGGSGGSGGTAGTGGSAGTGGTAGTGGSGDPAPTVTLTATPVELATGTATKVSWDVTDASDCNASGALWDGTRPADGGSEDFFIYQDTSFALSCTGPGGSDSDEVDVSINTSQLLLSVDFNLYLVKAGDDFDVDVTVSNPSSRTVENVFVTVVIPQYVIIAPGSLPGNAQCTGTGTCAAGEMIEWDLGNFGPGVVQTVSVTPEVAQNVPADQEINFEAVASADGEPDAVLTEVATEGESPLLLALGQSLEQPQAGDTVVYTLQYDNTGASPLPNVELTLTLPGPVDFVSATGGGTSQDGVVTWTFAQVPPGQGTVEATVTVDPLLPDGASLRAAASGTFEGSTVTTRATRLSVIADPDQCSSNTECGEREICDQELQQCIPHFLAFVEVNPAPVRPLEYVMVKVTVSNPGPKTETIDVNVPLPQGIARVSRTNISGDGACDFACDPGDVVRWTIVGLAPGDSELLWLRAQVASGASNGTQISFTANAEAQSGFGLQESGSTTVNSSRPLDLRVEESPNPAVPGQQLTYTIHYSNRSGGPLDPVLLSLQVPEGTTHPDGDTVSVNLGRLEAGEGGIETIAVDVGASVPLGSQLRAVAEIAETGSPTTTSQAVMQTPVAQTPLLVSIETNPDPVRLGEYVLTAVTVSNPSPSTQTFDVVLTLPQGMRRVAAANISGSGDCDFACDPGDVVRWTIVGLASGASELLWIRSDVINSATTNPDGRLISYDAEVRADNQVPIWVSSTTRVNNTRPLDLRVEESPNPAVPGQQLTYTIHYSNRSGGPLDPVLLSLQVPEGTTHPDGDTVSVNLGRLEAGEGGIETIAVDVGASVPLGSQLRAVAEIAETGSPTTTSQAVMQTPVAQTPLEAIVEVSSDFIARNALLTVNLTVSNPSPSAQTFDVVLTLPQGMRRVAAANISGSGDCDFACDPGDVVRWTIVGLASGASELLWIRSDVTNSATTNPDGRLIFYDAEVRANNQVPIWAGDSSIVSGP